MNTINHLSYKQSFVKYMKKFNTYIKVHLSCECNVMDIHNEMTFPNNSNDGHDTEFT